MKPERGWYSIIQYCPDLSRAEAANVGVLLFCPAESYLSVLLDPENERIRAFFGRDQKINHRRINAAKQALQDRIEIERTRIGTVEDLRQFIDTRAHTLQLTEPRALRVEGPAETLQSLFNELVVVGSVPAEPPDRSKRPLYQTFKQLEAERKQIQFDRQVLIPHLKIKFNAEYAYRNGTLNLVRIFELQHGGAKEERRALEIAAQSRFVDRHSSDVGDQAKVIVVIAPHGVLATPQIVGITQIFEDQEVELIRSADIDKFAQRVAAEAR